MNKMPTKEITNDPCVECGTPTLGVMTLANGSTVGVGINRLGYTDSNKGIDGWLCGKCAGYECDSCGKIIYLDEDITVVQGEHQENYKYHEECLTPELKLLAIEQGELNA
jgi:hypothetical protein